ncbi:hypothetical protein Q3G72_027017 [Acer saccharum]|nr:hypothetical protein Q3G72_027017 [Acer saccharum]
MCVSVRARTAQATSPGLAQPGDTLPKQRTSDAAWVCVCVRTRALPKRLHLGSHNLAIRCPSSAPAMPLGPGGALLCGTILVKRTSDAAWAWRRTPIRRHPGEGEI